MPAFGILHDFRKPIDDASPRTQYYAECLDEVATADRLGFESVWLSEHHFTADGMLPAPLVMCAAIATRTSQIKIATNIIILPLHNPLLIAEQAAVVDALSGGRVILAVGQGYADVEFATLGVDRRTRAALLEDGVATLRRAFGGDEVGPGVRLSPAPHSSIPVLIGAVAPSAVARAVRIADGLTVYCGRAADYLKRRPVIDSALHANARAGRSFPVTLTTIIHVDNDRGRAREQAAVGITYLESQLHGLRVGNSKSIHVDPSDYLVGTPTEVADQLVDLHHHAHFDRVAYWARLPGLTHARALETLDLVQRELIPAVHHRIRG